MKVNQFRYAGSLRVVIENERAGDRLQG